MYCSLTCSRLFLSGEGGVHLTSLHLGTTDDFNWEDHEKEMSLEICKKTVSTVAVWRKLQRLWLSTFVARASCYKGEPCRRQNTVPLTGKVPPGMDTKWMNQQKLLVEINTDLAHLPDRTVTQCTEMRDLVVSTGE